MSPIGLLSIPFHLTPCTGRLLAWINCLSGPPFPLALVEFSKSRALAGERKEDSEVRVFILLAPSLPSDHRLAGSSHQAALPISRSGFSNCSLFSLVQTWGGKTFPL